MKSRPTIWYYQKLLSGKTCRWCDDKVSLETQSINHYDHSDGWEIAGFTERQWLYVACPKCRYLWSLWKLGITGNRASGQTDNLNASPWQGSDQQDDPVTF